MFSVVSWLDLHFSFGRTSKIARSKNLVLWIESAQACQMFPNIWENEY